ncbi:hypothetical protein BH10ACI3_BH10ACI3_24400 [soil metagenome]
MTANLNIHNRFYEFGDFRIDAAKRLLRRNGELIMLPPRVFDTLFLLVSTHGELLTKREMLDEIWKDAFVEEGNLTQNIYLLRKMLGKMQDGREWIETLPRKGYAFAGDVTIGEYTNVSRIAGEPARNADTRIANRWIIAATVVLVLLGITAGAYFAYSSMSGRNSWATSRDVKLKKLSFSGDVEFPVISADGKQFAFSRNGRLFVQSVDGETACEIVLPEKTEAGFIQFAPDGRSLAFRDKQRYFLAGNVQRVSLDGGKPEVIAKNVWSGFSFSPDGRSLAFVRVLPDENRHELLLLDLTTGGEKALSELVGPSAFILVSAPAFSSDASRLAVAITKQEAQTPRSQLSVYDLSNGTVEEFVPQQLRQFEQPAWRPDGRSITVIGRENQKFFQVWELSYPNGRVTHVTNDLNIYRNLSMSADGRRLISANFTTFSHIWFAQSGNLSAQKQTTFGNLNRDGTIGMQWMPDGSIVYASRIVGNVDLWRAGPGELDKQQLTRESGDINAYPELAPDGSTIYFTSNRTGTTQIWKMDVGKPTDQTQITSGDKEINEFPQISPDGRWLYYLKKAKSEKAIWRRSLTDATELPIEVDGKLSPSSFLELSPDGKFLATCNLVAKSDEGDESQSFQVAIVATDRRAKPRMFNLPSPWITWSADGNGFEYAENKSGLARLWHQNFDQTPPLLLFESSGEYIAGVHWSPDGKTLAVSKGKRLNDVVLITDF